ncbi:hypothetical protein BV22DRAFT_705813 [Leucogyrophana mollusca]|uniref:Uncharacterized protein n=1 Tax=Leucogyrophana mollusca TaxID=85980 RepID=A0ACB8B7I4_9AGAM|nr:hypothetical protein BV22DRAFT_705813 [Leucogyrophana mollusca]
MKFFRRDRARAGLLQTTYWKLVIILALSLGHHPLQGVESLKLRQSWATSFGVHAHEGKALLVLRIGETSRREWTRDASTILAFPKPRLDSAGRVGRQGKLHASKTRPRPNRTACSHGPPT